MPIVCALFFVSGFAALIYQLLWFRHLGFIFGNTVYAATTVVAAFMAGLALGAWLFGRLAHRVRQAVRLFGALELGIGLYAVAMPLLFGLLREAYRWTYLHVSDSLPVLTALRFVLAFLLMLIPTTLMGGTLPVLSEALLRRHADFSRRLGWLYGVNTLGAVTGVMAAGFLLVPALGLRGTNLVAIAANLFIGVSALVLGRVAAARAPPTEVLPDTPCAVASPRLILIASSLAGFVALGFEVLWFRALTLVFGSTTYSFSAMLAAFLLGIALGSLVLGLLGDRVKNPLLLFALAELGIGFSLWGGMALYDRQPEFLLHLLARHGVTWPAMVSAQFLITLKILLLPTVLMGVAFTVAGKLVRAARPDPAQAVAAVYTWNTVGCVLGSLAAGFVALPALGLERSLELFCALAALLGTALVLRATAPGGRAALLGAVGVGGAVLMVFGPLQWDVKLLTSGPHFGPSTYLDQGRVIYRERLREMQVEFYREGAMATVAVTRNIDQNHSYLSGGKVEADSSPRSMMLQRIAGHLPLLVHPAPRVAVNIGLGAGVSLGALGQHPLEQLTVVEIEPAAMEVARRFGPWNHHIMDRPDLRVVIGDGRNFLFCTTSRFDVITSDPFEPVHAGANHLYTREHFRQARACLRPGGILSQYLPLYELSQEDFFSIIRSFADVFPDSVLFYTGDDTILLGFNGPVVLTAENLRTHFHIPAVQASLAELGFTRPETLLGMFVADLRTTPRLTQPGPLNTDDRPRVEFSAPKHALRQTSFDNIQVLLDIFTDLPDALLAGLTDEERARARDEHAALRRSLEAAVKRGRGDPAALEELVEASRLAPDNPILRNEVVSLMLPEATASLKAGDLQNASDGFRTILEWQPRNFWANHFYITLAMLAGQAEFAQQLLAQALELYPESGLIMAQRARMRATFGDVDGAIADFRRAAELQPQDPAIWEDMARIARRLDRPEVAAEAAATSEAILRAERR